MASARKTAANRANAQASSGPKTVQGKARVARNALRHGLSTLIATDPALSREADALAREIAGDTENPRILSTARAVAEAQIEIARIRRARYQLLSAYIEQAQPEAPTAPRSSNSADRVTAALQTLAVSLMKIDRYERRSFSRRKFAIRKLERLRKQVS